MAFALPFFLLMGWKAERKASFRLDRRDLAALFGLGLFGYYLASYLDFLGLQYITAALERLILFIYPTLVILLSAAFLGKPVTAGQSRRYAFVIRASGWPWCMTCA